MPIVALHVLQKQGAPQQLVKAQEVEVLGNHLDVTVAARDLNIGTPYLLLNPILTYKPCCGEACESIVGNNLKGKRAAAQMSASFPLICSPLPSNLIIRKISCF